MKENIFDVNLADMNEIFNNKTLRYRINGFAYACRMDDITVVPDSKVLSKNIEGNKHQYFIAVNENSIPKVKSVTLSGKYDDLSFTFVNSYKKEKLDKKIVDLPFYISLEKEVDDYTYKFDIETVEGNRTKFMITKFREFKDQTLRDDIAFYANIMDFSKILKLVKSFVYNPQLIFSTYNETIKNEKIVFTNSMVDKVVMQDENLDKPMSKVKKIMQRIANCD